MTGKGCDTCRYKAGESKDEEGNRTVTCALNEKQMYFPLAEECKHWVKDAKA